MPVLVGFRAVRPASSSVSWDTDAARNPARYILATVCGNSWRQCNLELYSFEKQIKLNDNSLDRTNNS